MQDIIVIQCAGGKTQESWRYGDVEIIFVADPEKYHEKRPESGLVPYKPDDEIPGSNVNWRQAFLSYWKNEKPPILEDAGKLPEVGAIRPPQTL